jgi:hypothetical protein
MTRAEANAACQTEFTATDLECSCGACAKDARACEAAGGGKGRVICAGYVANEAEITGVLGVQSNNRP